MLVSNKVDEGRRGAQVNIHPTHRDSCLAAASSLLTRFHHLPPETPLSVGVIAPFLGEAHPSLSYFMLYFSLNEYHTHDS